MFKRSDNVVILSGAIDVALVVAFVFIGRSSHGEGLLGALVTLWPFLIGLGVGWLLARAWREPRRLVWTAIIVWLATVSVGMLLRLVSDQGVQAPFVVVTLVVLGIFLLGWRALSVLVVRVLRGN